MKGLEQIARGYYSTALHLSKVGVVPIHYYISHKPFIKVCHLVPSQAPKRLLNYLDTSLVVCWAWTPLVLPALSTSCLLLEVESLECETLLSRPCMVVPTGSSYLKQLILTMISQLTRKLNSVVSMCSTFSEKHNICNV